MPGSAESMKDRWLPLLSPNAFSIFTSDNIREMEGFSLKKLWKRLWENEPHLRPSPTAPPLIPRYHHSWFSLSDFPSVWDVACVQIVWGLWGKWDVRARNIWKLIEAFKQPVSWRLGLSVSESFSKVHSLSVAEYGNVCENTQRYIHTRTCTHEAWNQKRSMVGKRHGAKIFQWLLSVWLRACGFILHLKAIWEKI